jgi:hypothetical protein
MFPLSIFPLPGELVPLHIFEPRYRQLIADCEARDISFGIFFNHTANTQKLGSLVKLESVIKRYAGGESDIIVKCTDLFFMDNLYRTYKDKLYPGGDVRMWQVDLHQPVSEELNIEFAEYLSRLKQPGAHARHSLFQVANVLSLDFDDRLRFVMTEPEKQENFLSRRIRYHLLLNRQAEQSKDTFHLN